MSSEFEQVATEDPLLVRTGVDEIKLDHKFNDETGDVTIFDPEQTGIGRSTRWITSDTAVSGEDSQ